MQNLKTNQKGITLIALIITIIVMLILVGVTINVALNGGLFEKGEKAAFQTGASTVKEQLELAKALKLMNNQDKVVEDYSDITVRNLPGLDKETQNKYASIIVVAKNGNICYNPASVTDKQKTWLEEIGIKEYMLTPDDLIKDRVYGPTNYIHIVFTTDNQIKTVYSGSIIDALSYAEVEIYTGTLAQLITQRFPEYEGYEIKTGAEQFRKYVIGDGKLVGAFDDTQNFYYVVEASEREAIEVGYSYKLDSSLTLEDILQ